MMSFEEILIASALLLIYICIAAGSFFLHRHAGSRASRLLLFAILGFAMWLPVSAGIRWSLANHYAGRNDVAVLSKYAVLIQINMMAIGLLALVASVAFLVATRSLSERPNNSSKPMPPRDVT